MSKLNHFFCSIGLAISLAATGSAFATDITGAGATGAALVNHPEVDKIAFTGETTTGRLIMQYASENLIPVTLELGGKSPAIVSRSANLRVAARKVAHGRLFNAGQAAALLNINFDQPVHEQYVQYLGNVVRGDLGNSYRSRGLKVIDIISQVLPWTLFSVGLSLLVTFTVGKVAGPAGSNYISVYGTYGSTPPASAISATCAMRTGLSRKETCARPPSTAPIARLISRPSPRSR